MGRLIGAVVAGYVSYFAGVMIFLVATSGGKMPDMNVTPSQSFLIISTLVGLLMAIVGGYVSAWVARRSDMKAIYGLIGLMTVMMVISFPSEIKVYPLWYCLAWFGAEVAGAWLGGRLRLRRPAAS